MTKLKQVSIKSIIRSANTGLDAIKRAPIVDTDTGFRCLRIQDVSQRKDFASWGFTKVEERNYLKFQLRKNDILIARTGASIGVNIFIHQDKKAVFNNGLIRIRVNEVLCHPKYLYYNFRTTDYNGFIESISGGTSTQPNMQINALLSYEVNLPHLTEQQSIASILSSLDDKIDLLHRQNKTLEAMAEALFRKWFVDEAKESWPSETFAKWINETVGGEWGKENAEGDFCKAVYCIRGTDIADLNIGVPLKMPVRFVKEKKFDSIEPQEGDLIIEISGGTENQSTGRVCYINKDIKKLFKYPLVFSNFCRMIRIKKSEYTFFVYCYIQYLYKQDEFFNLENGSSGIKNLDYKALLFEIEYPMPPEDVVLSFYEVVVPLFKKVNQNKAQVSSLASLRDTLLPKLMSGELPLK